MGLYNITDLRKAQQYVKDLEKILKIINIAEVSLRNYEHYRAVQHLLTTIHSEKPFLEISLEQHRITVELKGQKK